jgi:hypothetical protein
MKMSHVNPALRAIGLGLVCACLAFTVALATSGDASGRGTGLGNRAINTNYMRPPVTIVTDSDLGVVVVGSHFTRQIIAQFGFKPHSFLFGGLTPTSSFTISASGEISGSKTETGVETFEVRVFDPALKLTATPTTKTFTITGVDATGNPPVGLYFVNAPVLPNAVANEPYTFTMHVNGGNPPYLGFNFETSDDLARLPAGLALDGATGEIFGRPIVPTTTPATFSILALDSSGTIAKQTFSLTVLPGTISSEFVATSGNFRLNFGSQGDSDSLKLQITLNKTQLANNNIRDISDLAGVNFQMSFGGFPVPNPVGTDNDSSTITDRIPQQFDKNGSLRFPDALKGNLAKKGEPLKYEISLDPKRGILKVNMSGVSMISTLHANFKSFKDPIIPVNIKMGVNASSNGATTTTTGGADVNSKINFDSTDIIKFQYRRKGNIGRGSALANTKVPPGGQFLITKVSGVEVKTGEVTDRVIMKFSGLIRNVGGAPISFKTGDTVAILLGEFCIGEFPATSLKAEGDKLTFRNDDLIAGLQNFVIDNKKGSIYFDTHPMLPFPIFRQDILNGGEAMIVPVTLTITSPGTLTPSFDGQSSVPIYRRGGHLQSK